MLAESAGVRLVARQRLRADKLNYYAVSPFDVPTLQAELLTTLTASDTHRNWYALVDMAFDAGRKLFQWPSEPFPVYFDGRLKSFASISPCLLPLSTGDTAHPTDELTRLLRHCQGRPMLGFIRSQKTPDDIRQSWQRVLEVETSDRQKFVLRFADTRVTPVIAETFPPSVWARLTHGIDDWLTIDREGTLQSLPVAGPQADRLDDQALVPIDDETLSRILQSGEADALASVLHEKFPDLLTAEQGASVYKRLAATSKLAAKYGMESPSDQLLLAVAVCLSDGRLLDDEKFLSWFKNSPWASDDFADALGQFAG